MKKALIGLIALFLFITGCNPNPEHDIESDNYEIEKVSVVYTDSENNNVKIAVDLVNEIKSITNYSEDSHETENFGIVNKNDLEKFLKNNIVPELIDCDYTNKTYGDAAWTIKVVTDTETITIKGNSSDKMPEFGESLIEML